VDLPDGLTARRPTQADADLIHALVVACDVADRGTSDATLVEVAGDLGAPGADLERGGWLVLRDGSEPADRAPAAGWLWTRADPDATEVFIDAYALDPVVVRWLVREAMDYAREVATGWGRPVTVAAGSYAQDQTYGDELAAAGLEVVRRFWHMGVDIDPAGGQQPPAEPSPTGPAGEVSVRPVDADDPAELALLHRLHEESFADHWNHTARPYEAWHRRLLGTAGVDPSQWWVAEVEGRPAGLLIGSDRGAELGEGYVQTLGVVPSERGRGVGKSLLRHAFDDAVRRGRRRVVLGVDSENPTGATALYESVGMSVDVVLLAWQATVEPEPA
jgi:ribosomal protein S18 acetylase RimI-like enzyme